jgi:hypothetical protein
VRVNEAFGDTINWDLIPQAAIGDVTLMPGSNPLYGLNTLGAAIALRTKSGDTDPGGEIEAYGGSFGRISAQFELGRALEDGWHAYAAGTGFNENGWRDYSPSTVGQLFAKIGRRKEAYEFDVSVTGASTDLVGNGLVPQSMLAQSQTAIFTRPDQTKNQLGMLTLAGNAWLADGSQLAGTAYFRSVRTRTLNGDVNDDFEDAVDEGDADAANAVSNRSRTQQNSAGAALQWSVISGIHQAALGATFDASRSSFQQGGALGMFDASRGVVDTEPYELEDALDGSVNNLGLKDIEEIAARHPAIREVAVFGIPHDKWGETPVAAVVLRANEHVEADALRDWINARVAAKYQRLDRVLVLPDFPRNAAGKTLKRELRAPFWEGHERKI